MSEISVVPFQTTYAGDFRRLNLDWIERLFKVEAADRKVLEDPEGAIMDKGGMIFFALDGEAVVGTVAMILAGERRCELAKDGSRRFAPTPRHRRTAGRCVQGLGQGHGHRNYRALDEQQARERDSSLRTIRLPSCGRSKGDGICAM